MTILFHICSTMDWEAGQAVGAYTAGSLNTEGFIHCSLLSQILGVANNIYVGQTDLVLLVIDSAALTESLIYEDSYDHGQEFPHIYGPVNLDAVVGVVDFPAGSDGRFILPAELAGAD